MNRYTTLFTAIIIVFFSFSKLQAETTILETVSVSQPRKYPSQSSFFKVNEQVFQQLKNNLFAHCELPLRIGEKIEKAVLTRFHLTDNATTFLANSYGVETSFVPEDVVLLSGNLVNSPQSFVYLAVFKNYAVGYCEKIENSVRVRYLIAPLSLDKKKSSTLIMYKDNGQNKQKKQCLSEDLPEYYDLVNKVVKESGEVMKDENPDDKDQGKDEHVHNSTTLTVQLALDLDDALYAAHQRDISRAVNYVMTVWGGVAAIYKRDAQVTFRINYMRVWTTTDPYPGTSTDMLGQFRNYWNTNMRHVNRTLAHLMSGHGFGGVAWVGVLCADVKGGGGYGYAANGIGNNVTYPSPSYVWDLDVVSHETGHNFGSPHTHNCGWSPAIDSCFQAEGGCYQGTRPRRGTIMSYCHLTSFGTQLFFHPRVANLLRDRAEKAQCIYPENGIVLNDVGVMDFESPKAGSKLQTKTNFVPRVRIANIGKNNRTTLKVRYEVLFPVTHQVLYSDSVQVTTLSAGQSTVVQFKQMNIADTGQWLLRASLVNSGDTNVWNDEKTIPIHCSPSVKNTGSLQVVDINTSITVDAGTQYVLRWQSKDVKTVRLFLTTDDGKTWENIISNYPADSLKYTWKIPYFPTQSARIRIDNFENSLITDVSDRTFTIRVVNDVQPLEYQFPEVNASLQIPRFIPAVSIKNNSSQTIKNIPVILKMKHASTGNRFYRDTVVIDELTANAIKNISFDTVVLRRRGTIEMIVRTFYANDGNAMNDSLTRSFSADTTVNAPMLISPANESIVNPEKIMFRWSSVVGAKEYKITIQRRLLGNFFSFSQFITKDTFFTFRNTDKVQDTIVKMSWYVEVVFENQMNEISEIWNYTLPVWKYNSSNKSFYAAVTGNTWLMALGLSKNAGLYMSTVRNKQENDFIRNNFTGDLRIGLTDRRKEADWKWVSGEPTTFQQWSPNQPDNFQNNEHYINILQNGLWNDITEGQINHVTIYEYPHYIQSEVGNLQPPRLNLPENKSSLLSEEQLFTWDRAKDALGYYFQLALDSTFTEPILTLRLSNNYCSTTTGQFPQNGVYYWRVRSFGQDTLLSPWSELRQCVYFRWRMSKINGHGYEETPSLTWEEAHAYAQRFGAHLATVRSLAENKWIDSTFGVKNKWIGINDREKEGEYVWSSGEKSTFTHWNNGEPNNFGGVEDYGHIGDNPEGKWNDNNPNARFVGIMERVSSISPSPIIVSPPPIIRVAELPLTLRWRKNNASSIYNIQIATDEKFTTIVTDQSQANDTTFIIKSLSSPSGEYYWRVRSRGNSTFGEWSDVRLIVLGNNTKDLVAHWDFNNIETGIIFDKSAKLYNAQILNNYPIFTNGEKGAALHFLNENNAMTAKVQDSASFTKDFTVAFWMNNTNPKSNGALLDAYNEKEKRGFKISILNSMNEQSLELTIDDKSVIAPLMSESNRIYYMAFVKKDDTLSIYYDSYRITAIPFTKSTTLPWASAMFIGAENISDTVRNPLDIVLEDIRLYKRALTSQDMLTIMDKDVSSVYEQPNYMSDFSITPNPAHDRVHFSNVLGKEFTVTIFSTLGAKLYSTSSQQNSAEWNCSDVASGLYYVTFTIDGSTQTVPIIIAH
jgi:hypothetical protein